MLWLLLWIACAPFEGTTAGKPRWYQCILPFWRVNVIFRQYALPEQIMQMNQFGQPLCFLCLLRLGSRSSWARSWRTLRPSFGCRAVRRRASSWSTGSSRRNVQRLDHLLFRKAWHWPISARAPIHTPKYNCTWNFGHCCPNAAPCQLPFFRTKPTGWKLR